MENRSFRERLQRLEKSITERRREVDHAFEKDEMQFWCDHCKKDFSAMGYKREFSATGLVCGWYEGACLCGRKAIKRITDKSKDPYYYKSEMIKFQRVRNYNDTLTPVDDLFRIIYPKEYGEREKSRE